MIHTFTIKIQTPESITEQEVLNKFCKANNYNPDFGETKAKFFKRLVGAYIIDQYKRAKTLEKEEVARTELSTELEGITTSQE